MTFKRWRGPDLPAPNGPAVIEFDLDATDEAPARARAVLDTVVAGLPSDVLERTRLLLSEVVANSVQHAGGERVHVDVWPSGDAVDVCVSDEGPGFVPLPAPDQASGGSGFGLVLVDALAEGWGSGHGDGAWVWFAVASRAAPQPTAGGSEDVGQDLLDVRMVVDSVKGHALIALDSDGSITNWGSPAQALTGYRADDVLGRSLADLYAPASRGSADRDRARAAVEGWHHAERWIRRRDGSDLWADVALAPIVDRSGRERGLSALLSDHTDQKRQEDAYQSLIADLRERALTDELTGLPNRRRWTEDLNRDLARARRHGTQLAIAMLDLDGFKQINDTRGHAAGDEVLVAVATAWSAAVRDSDLLARYGGDEFAVILNACPRDLAMSAVRRIQQATPSPMTTSAGVAVWNGVESAHELVRRADSALYRAKRGDGFSLV